MIFAIKLLRITIFIYFSLYNLYNITMKNHEFLYGSMNIKIPESIFYVLVEDCHRFGFIKNDEANFSGYINDIIPKLSKMREEKHNTILKYNDYDENLTRIIEKNIYNVYLKEFDLEDDNIGDLSFRIKLLMNFTGLK